MPAKAAELGTLRWFAGTWATFKPCEADDAGDTALAVKGKTITVPYLTCSIERMRTGRETVVDLACAAKDWGRIERVRRSLMLERLSPDGFKMDGKAYFRCRSN